MEWKMIKPTAGTGGRVDTFRVTKYKNTKGCRALLVVPECDPLFHHEKVNIFTDGNGKMAVKADADGRYGVFKRGNAKSCKIITVPSELSETIPLGTTEIEVTREGDLVVFEIPRAS